MQKISPFLWFDQNAEEAVNFYLSVFPRSQILSTVRYGDAGPGPKGSVMTIAFQIEGQDFTALNGGPHYKFSPATSFVVQCQTQTEVDTYWEKLSADGTVQQCGWLTDKFGVTWQIVPTALLAMIQDSDSMKVARMTQAMMKMVKLDIATLKRAFDGVSE